jgi:hypothetical protein
MPTMGHSQIIGWSDPKWELLNCFYDEKQTRSDESILDKRRG